MFKLEVVDTGDGSKTLYIPEMGEQYHSINGAVGESKFVFLERGYSCHQAKNPSVFEIGFGTGLNCLLTALEAGLKQRPTTYFTLEKYPLGAQITAELNYGSLISEEAKEIFAAIHACQWNEKVALSPYFELFKLNADLIHDDLKEIPPCNIIYFDAFAPGKQPEIWTSQIFRKISEKTLPSGIFVTYSAKGEVRRQLTAAGYQMERLPGPPGKKEMLRGIKVATDL